MFVLTHSAQVVALISYSIVAVLILSSLQLELNRWLNLDWYSACDKLLRVYGIYYTVTVLSSSFHFISTSQGKQYSTNTDYMRLNGTVRQMNDALLVKLMGCTVLYSTVPKMELYSMVQEDTVLSHPTKKRKIPYRAICAPPPLFPLIFHLYLYPFRVCA